METSWWEERMTFPAVRGHIATSEAPDFADTVAVEGGPHYVFMTAAVVIAAFERRVAQSGVQEFSLKNIELREKASLFDQKKVPLCPDPMTVKADTLPQRVRSLGVVVNYSKFWEIWYIARISVSPHGFRWRLDWTQREKWASKAVALFEFPFMLQNSMVDGNPGESVTQGPAQNAANKAKEYLPMIFEMWMDAVETGSHLKNAPTHSGGSQSDSGARPGNADASVPGQAPSGRQEQPKRRD